MTLAANKTNKGKQVNSHYNQVIFLAQPKQKGKCYFLFDY
jgi:hypothetical protein